MDVGQTSLKNLRGDELDPMWTFGPLTPKNDGYFFPLTASGADGHFWDVVETDCLEVSPEG